jgi:hypothetical protein
VIEPARWLPVFLAMFCTDIAWGRYVQKVRDKRGLAAAAWAVLLFLSGAYAVVSYVSDPWLLIPAAAGAFCGTLVAVRRDRT